MDRVLGGYTLRRELGRGGMGVVHLASTPTGGLAAVKVIHPELARDPAFRRRFDREVAAARRVARFCTAPVLDAGLEGETAYLVTEYIKGPDLSHAVRDQGPMSGSDLEALAVGIAVALGAIHGAGVIHRDLKPSNVLLSAMGPRVIDFGIAQLVDATSVATQTLMGTPAYMAPEHVRGEQVTAAADIYSWGGVIAFAGTGRLPFGGGAPAEVIYRIVSEGPNLDGLDHRLRGLVETAMAKDPVKRPTVQDLLAELTGSPAPATVPKADGEITRVVQQAASPEPPTAVVEPAPPQRPRRRRRPLIAAAGVIATAAVAGLGIWLATSQGTPELPYTAGFDAWETGASKGGNAAYADGTYTLTANPGWRLWKSAPAPAAPKSGVVATARGRFADGSGSFGVWCGGSWGRYEFGVSSGGKISIVEQPSGGLPDTLLEERAEVKKDNRVVAECRPGKLSMRLNGRLVGTAKGARDGRRTGVQAVPDTGAPLAVRFDAFDMRPAG